MYVSLIKSLAEKIGFKEIREKDGYINIKFANRDDFSIDELKDISQEYKGDMKLDLSANPSFRIPTTNTKLIDTYDLLEVISNVRSKNEKDK